MKYKTLVLRLLLLITRILLYGKDGSALNDRARLFEFDDLKGRVEEFIGSGGKE